MYVRQTDTNIFKDKTYLYKKLYNREYFTDLITPTQKFRDELQGNIPNFDHSKPKGKMSIRKLDRGSYKLIIEVMDMPINSVFSIENVTKMTPFTSQPFVYNSFNGLLTDKNGMGMKVIHTKNKPALMLILNYHTGDGITNEDNKISSVYKGILTGLFPINLE
jgi:hypothetical protein